MRLEVRLCARRGAFTLNAQGAFNLSGVTAVFGPSGAGKSTLLRAIAGFEPQLGDVTAEGAAWQGAGAPTPPHRRPIAMVFQDGRLFDHLNVRGNLLYAYRRRLRPIDLWDEVIETLELKEHLHKAPAQLSGGERQRVAIGRALLRAPRLVLMDEPLAALDRARKDAIQPLIKALPQKFGAPVLMVTHSIEEIAAMADDLIAMRGGEIVAHGAAPETLQSLDPTLTGAFDAGVLLTGRLKTYDEALLLSEILLRNGRSLWTPGRAAQTLGAHLRVRVRARDVSIATAALEGVSIRNQLPARLINLKAEESSPYAELTLDCDGMTLKARITRHAAQSMDLAPGAQVVALIKAAALEEGGNGFQSV